MFAYDEFNIDHTWLSNSSIDELTNTPKHIVFSPNTVHRTQNIQGYNITFTTSQVQEALKQSKNNNSQGPDKLIIRHLKHIDPLGLTFLMNMFKTALNKNIIPHTWRLANIVPIPKPNKRHKQWYLIQAHIPPLSNCIETGEEPSSLHNSKHTHATRVQNTTLYSDGTTHTK